MNKDQVRKEMSNVLDQVRSEIASIRTGRVNSSLVSDVTIPAYGGTQKLRVMELANINVPDPQTLVIEPWDKSIIGEIKQGLMAANLGFNPVIDGEIIRISFPPLTGEDREKYIKLLNSKLEEGRVMVRRVRGDAMRSIKEAFELKEISEDEKFSAERELQELTDEHIAKIEEIGGQKEHELREI